MTVFSRASQVAAVATSSHRACFPGHRLLHRGGHDFQRCVDCGEARFLYKLSTPAAAASSRGLRPLASVSAGALVTVV